MCRMTKPSAIWDAALSQIKTYKICQVVRVRKNNSGRVAFIAKDIISVSGFTLPRTACFLVFKIFQNLRCPFIDVMFKSRIQREKNKGWYHLYMLSKWINWMILYA